MAVRSLGREVDGATPQTIIGESHVEALLAAVNDLGRGLACPMIEILEVDSLFTLQFLQKLFGLHLESLPEEVILDALDLDNDGLWECRCEFAFDGDVLW